MFKWKKQLSDFKILLLEEDGSTTFVDSLKEVKKLIEEKNIYDVYIPLPSGETVRISRNNLGTYQLK